MYRRRQVIRNRNNNEIISPDKTKAAFIRDWNLWMRDIATGKEIQLTDDGVENFGYATDNAGWTHSDRAILLWSPDSKKIATFQQDQRNVSDMYLVSTNVGAPKLEAWKYPLPEDKDIIKIHRVIIETETPKVIRLKMPPDDTASERSATTFRVRARLTITNGMRMRANSLLFPDHAITNRRI